MHTLKDDTAKRSEVMGMVPTRFLPSFSVTVKDLPEIKGWKVGKKYMLEMEVEMTSMSKDEYMDKSFIEARFKIHKIGEKEMMSAEEKEARMGHY